MKTYLAFSLAAAGWLMMAPEPLHGDPGQSDPGQSDPRNGAADTANEIASWSPPSPAKVREQVFGLLADRRLDQKTMAKATRLWPAAGALPKSGELLDLVAKTLALADPRADRLVRLCDRPLRRGAMPEAGWLTEKQTPPILGNNLRLLMVRSLAHARLYDELLQQAEGLTPDDVVDPAALLFYRGVAQHHLLQVEPCLESVATLLQRGDWISRRYEAVARLMRSDLEGVKDDSLDHISRRMDDIGRRLALGRAGQKVRDVEDGVIESLDKMIKKIEDEKNKQNQPNNASTPSGTPATESRIARGRGQGKVDRRDTGSGSGWGDLPAKQREQALQQIGKDFPSHYREVIEEYFRKLANEQRD